MLRKKLLTAILRATAPKKKKPTYAPMLADPKELAKAMFWENDQKFNEQKHL